MRFCSLLGLVIASLLTVGCNRGTTEPTDDRVSDSSLGEHRDSSWDDRGDAVARDREDPFARRARHEYRRDADDVELVSELPERRYDRDTPFLRDASRSERAAEREEDAADAAADRFVRDPDGDDLPARQRDDSLGRRGEARDRRVNDRMDQIQDDSTRTGRRVAVPDDAPRSRATLDEMEDDEPRTRRPTSDIRRTKSRARDEE